MKYSVSQETGLGKPYDRKLMKRLLTFIRPYRTLFAITFILVMVIAAAQLVRPYLIKVAIDDHINGLYIPMIVVEDNDLHNTDINHLVSNQTDNIVTFTINDELLIRNSTLEPAPNIRQIVKANEQFLLINGIVESPTNPATVTEISANEYLVEGLHAIPLTTEQVEQIKAYDIKSLYKLAIIYLAIIIVAFIVGYIQIYLLQYLGQRIVYDIREQAFAHLQKMSLSYFDTNPVGRLVTRITNDTENINEMYSSVIISLFKDILIIVGIMGVLLYMDWRLAIVSFSTVPLMLFISFFYRRKARAAFRDLRVHLARINSNIQESLSGIKVIRAFGLQKDKFDEFSEINQAHLKANMRELFQFSLFRPSMDMVYALTLALLLWFGGGSVIKGAIQFGVLYAFIQYSEQFFRPIRDLAEKYNIMQSAMASAERLFELLDEPEQISDPAQPKSLAIPVQGFIKFNNVTFSYDQQHEVLKDVSFQINAGETIAIVGATGSGKTTILHLLSRFYDVQTGSIEIDGIDIRQLPKQQLRKLIGIVQQDVFLFTGDIKANIHLNNPDISEQQVIEIAKYVNAHEFIEKLPNKYHEPVTERGSTLSTGQRQLLAFARTLVHDPRILLLDEATSNIDTYTEKLIQDALPKLSKGRTTLIVAHRLSTIQNADRILVIHKGRLIEQGTHEELLQKQSYYYTLYKMQYQQS